MNIFFFVAENLSFWALSLRLNILLWINTSGSLKVHMPKCVLCPVLLAHSLCSHLWVDKNLTDGRHSVSVYGPDNLSWLVSEGEVHLHLSLGKWVWGDSSFLLKVFFLLCRKNITLWIPMWWKHLCHQWMVQYVAESSALMIEMVLRGFGKQGINRRDVPQWSLTLSFVFPF